MLTVLTPAASHDLATLEAVKAELEISGTADDTVLAALIRQASGAIAVHCRRTFARENVREVFRSRVEPHHCLTPVAELILDRTPVASVVSVIEDGSPVDPADYEIDKANGLLRRLSGGYEIDWWARRIVVDYVGGYELPAGLPPDLERICVDLVKRYFYARSRDPNLRSEQILDVISQSFHGPASAAAITAAQTGMPDDGLPPDIAGRLTAYRNL